MWSSQLADYLDAIAVWKRGLWLTIDTPELLRQGGSRHVKARQQKMLAVAREQLREQMRARRRRPFRADVSVEVSIFAGDDAAPPSAPKSVKRYLDALSGIAYLDDRQVAHLSVNRFTGDHPMLRRFGSLDVAPVSTTPRRDVYLTVVPARLYARDHDRFFALGRDLRRLASEWDLDDEATAFFEDAWDPNDDLRLDELRDERRREQHGRGVAAILDDDLTAWILETREREIAELEGRLLLDQRPDRDDRPGPGKSDTTRLPAGVALASPRPISRYESPGRFWLPLPPEFSGGPPWEQTVRSTMARHRERWTMLPQVFDQPLALDISIDGAGGNSRDVDNTAHAVLTAFESIYCGERRGTVVRYRVYRRFGDTLGVRVQVMTEERLRQLDAGIEAARGLVVRAGSRDLRDL
ncbi:RusA family crossover junction endodeoxyribonuclease [Solirubrobacter ginsenosidimutans]|uniref:RusA family crossover junction endodeoxyribonuclease n=1 Tax=Solirubrobacter ginsenosidimutans TaxID=490573 RepID=A0A9X3MQA8_9ACTN|nr:hypothetical protein [Solirubrobacter ginsenosidimutans]MDA0160467.1 RusA family crossover junction endodeoxyribonuclease [Solirubrobacter ginsenosidimutans]